jgi:AraC-like DNA-binding protein
MEIHLYDLPVIVASGLAFLMAFTTYRWPRQFRNQVLAFLYASAGFLELVLYLTNTGNIVHYPNLLYFGFLSLFLIGPLKYFYLLSLMGIRESWRARDLLHLIPALSALPYFFPGMLDDPISRRIYAESISSGTFEVMKHPLPLAGIVLIYIYSATALIRVLPSVKRENRNQQVILIFMFFSLLLIVGLTTGVIAVISASFIFARMMMYAIALFIIAQFVISERYPYLIWFSTIHDTKRTGGRSGFEKLDVEALRSRLEYLMKEEKFFCDEDLSLSRLSQALEITPHQLSFFLNEYYRRNFNSYVNTYRIGEAKRLLLEEPRRNALSIALSTGFNSYSAFFSAFKREEGISPADFRKRYVREG